MNDSDYLVDSKFVATQLIAYLRISNPDNSDPNTQPDGFAGEKMLGLQNCKIGEFAVCDGIMSKASKTKKLGR